LSHDAWRWCYFVAGNVQRCKTSQPEIFAPDKWCVRLQSQILGSSRQRFKCQLPFDSRQRGPETKVAGPAKRQVPVVRARDVEAIRIGEPIRIAIAGGHDRNYRLTFAD
jgi:hypothetical protein